MWYDALPSLGRQKAVEHYFLRPSAPPSPTRPPATARHFACASKRARRCAASRCRGSASATTAPPNHWYWWCPTTASRRTYRSCYPSKLDAGGPCSPSWRCRATEKRTSARREIKLLRNNHLGQYYVVVVQYRHYAVPRHTADRPRVVALDPGSRTFHSYYASDGRAGELGTNRERILRHALRLDRLQSRLSKSSASHQRRTSCPGLREPRRSRRGRHHRRRERGGREAGPRVLPLLAHRARPREPRALVARVFRLPPAPTAPSRLFTAGVEATAHAPPPQAHARQGAQPPRRRAPSHGALAVRALRRRPSLPKFKTSSMLPGLANRAARMLASWAHYRFKCLLKHTAEKSGVRIVDVNEHYTSKTCGRCGVLNGKNALKVFTCSACGLVADRDVHAARNILSCGSCTTASSRRSSSATRSSFERPISSYLCGEWCSLCARKSVWTCWDFLFFSWIFPHVLYFIKENTRASLDPNTFHIFPTCQTFQEIGRAHV